MVAIVIPYYKIEFFEETLQSLAAQTDKRFKVYIGNDASTADPEKILSKYENNLDFEYKLFENNLGSSSLVMQWERCLEMKADEQWVMLLCDDDVLHPDCISDFYKNLDEIEESGVNVIRFSSIVIDKNHNELAEKYIHPKIEKATDFLIRKHRGGTRSSLSEYIYRSDKVTKIKFKEFPLAWHSDVLAVLEFSEFKTIFTINSSCVYFRFSDVNITGKKDNLTLKNIATFKFYKYLLTNCRKYFDKEQLDVLYKQLEKTFLDNKKNSYFAISLTKMYIAQWQLKRYIYFAFKYMKSIIAFK